MAARKKQGTLEKMERVMDEYVVEPVKKLVGMDGKSKAGKKAAAKKRAAPALERSAVNRAKPKSGSTSRAGGVTRRRAGTPGTRSAR